MVQLMGSGAGEGGSSEKEDINAKRYDDVDGDTNRWKGFSVELVKKVSRWSVIVIEIND